MVKYKTDLQGTRRWSRPGALLAAPCAMLALAVGLPTAGAAPAPAGYAAMAPLARYLSADQASEVALARTAAPKSISAHATVLAFGKDGYATAVKGTNGFVCFVQRSWANDFDNDQFWNPRIRTPQCWNAAAAASVLPDYLNRTKWVLAGATKAEMVSRTKAEFSSHELGAPAPGSMAYMMSKEQYINDPAPQWYPHVMFFVSATDGSPWGANMAGGPLFSASSDVEPITTYFLVVPKWSDGSPGPYAANSGKAAHHHHG